MLLTRRRLLFALPLACPALATDHSLRYRLNDGSIWTKGFQNSYPYQRIIHISVDGDTVNSYQLVVTARLEQSINELLQTAGFEFQTQTDLPGFPGQPLVVQMENVKADFHVLVNGRLFLGQNIDTKTVSPKDMVAVRMLTTGTLKPA